MYYVVRDKHNDAESASNRSISTFGVGVACFDSYIGITIAALLK